MWLVNVYKNLKKLVQEKLLWQLTIVALLEISYGFLLKFWFACWMFFSLPCLCMFYILLWMFFGCCKHVTWNECCVGLEGNYIVWTHPAHEHRTRSGSLWTRSGSLWTRSGSLWTRSGSLNKVRISLHKIQIPVQDPNLFEQDQDLCEQGQDLCEQGPNLFEHDADLCEQVLGIFVQD